MYPFSNNKFNLVSTYFRKVILLNYFMHKKKLPTEKMRKTIKTHVRRQHRLWLFIIITKKIQIMIIVIKNNLNFQKLIIFIFHGFRNI